MRAKIMTVVTETLEDLQRSIRNRRLPLSNRNQAKMGYALAARWDRRAAAHCREGEFHEAGDADSEAASIRAWARSIDPRIAA